MNQLLERMNAEDLLQKMPENVRTSLESFLRSGTEWDVIGHLLAGTSTTGVALTGTGQWTANLWDAVKWEFRSFLCTDSEPYAELRKEWDELKQNSSTLAVGSLAKLIGARLGVSSGVVAPLVTWLFVVAHRTGKESLCLALSAAPATGFAQHRTPYA